MKNQSNYYKELSEKQPIYDRGFSASLQQLSKVNYSEHEVSRSLGLYTTSVFWRLFQKPYRKELHVNGKSAALLFHIQDSAKSWVPWTKTKYYILDENCPNLIVRNIRFHKYLGEVKVLNIDGDWLDVETFEGKKTVSKKIFIQNAVNSIKEWVGKEELERMRFNDRMKNTDHNPMDNHCSKVD